MAMSATYKPSPLSYGSPRTSPFRRPESPASPSTVRGTTPTSSPTKLHTPFSSPSKADARPEGLDGRSIRGLTPMAHGEGTPSPTRTMAPSANGMSTSASTIRPTVDASSKVNASQMRELREAFQLLDRDGDGVVGREDVVDMLSNLGQDSSQHAISAFFPPGKPQNLPLAQFLAQLSTLLGSMSRPDELASAFAAFDEDDNGQIAVAELRDTLLHTAPDPSGARPLSGSEIDRVLDGFTGRKTVGKKLGKEDVFRYQEFLAAVTGAGGKGGQQQEQKN